MISRWRPLERAIFKRTELAPMSTAAKVGIEHGALHWDGIRRWRHQPTPVRSRVAEWQPCQVSSALLDGLASPVASLLPSGRYVLPRPASSASLRAGR